jgi:zinc transport system substrate-binding protein
MKKIKILLIVVLAIFLTGCDILMDDTMEDIDVYTTTYPTNYLIKYLYGDHSTIRSIYPSGINFKDYELSDKKISEYAKSDLFIYNSQDIDRDIAVKMINENKNLKLIDTAIGMTYNYSPQELWLNPYNYLMMAKNIKDTLGDYITNPYLVEEINNNYEKLNYELSKLDANYKETISSGKYNVIVTDSSIFKYLEKYNIEVISLEENIVELTIKKNDTLSDISTKYGVSTSDILTYNNKKDETLTEGETIKIPIKVIESSDVNKVKKLISEKTIKYIYTDNEETNKTVSDLIKEYKLELIPINTMYNVDGGSTNNNEDYLTIMADNLELYKKELYK